MFLSRPSWSRRKFLITWTSRPRHSSPRHHLCCSQPRVAMDGSWFRRAATNLDSYESRTRGPSSCRSATATTWHSALRTLSRIPTSDLSLCCPTRGKHRPGLILGSFFRVRRIWTRSADAIQDGDPCLVGQQIPRDVKIYSSLAQVSDKNRHHPIEI